MAEHSAKKRTRPRQPAITARPKPPSAEVRGGPISEPGLSVDPEDLGQQFLSEATEQANFESTRVDPPELDISREAPSDDALVGPNFDPDHSVWEQTVDLSLQGNPDDEPLSETPRNPRRAPPRRGAHGARR